MPDSSKKISPPEQCRKVFELIVLKDMKYKEVADFLGLSVNTVKTLFCPCIETIAQFSYKFCLFSLLTNSDRVVARKDLGGVVIR